jgi:hypothetical protein
MFYIAEVRSKGSNNGRLIGDERMGQNIERTETERQRSYIKKRKGDLK